MEEMEEEEVFHGQPLADAADPACRDPDDPYNYYSNRNFSSNINNMMTGMCTCAGGGLGESEEKVTGEDFGSYCCILSASFEAIGQPSLQ